MKTSRDQAARDNRAAQLNAEHPTYHRARGLDPRSADDAARAARRLYLSDVPSSESPSPPTEARKAR